MINYFNLIVIFSFVLTFTESSPKFNSNNNTQFKKEKQLKILVFSPSLSWSHAQYLGRIADTLVEAGHEVHFVKFIMSSFLKDKNETTKVHKVYIIEKSLENDELLDFKHSSMVADSFNKKRPVLSIFDHLMTQFGPMAAMSCKETIQKRDLIQKLINEHFDVGIAEMYEFCGVALFHKIGVKTKISAYAISLFQSVSRLYDIPNFPSFMSNFMSPRKDLEFSFFSRLINFYNEFYDWIWMDNQAYRFQDPIIREEFGADFPNLRKLIKNVSLIFINSNPFFETPRPISNKVIYIGGLADEQMSKNTKILDHKTQRILDEAVNGAILFSFGSLADTTKFNNKMLSAILGAFKHFPQIQFIWKLDNETSKNISKLLQSIPNVHTFEWIRQTAILAHPNLKAFITHCGQNSLNEAARAGIPVIGVPLFADQFYNSDFAEKRRMGLQIDIIEFSGVNAENILIEAIERILKDPSFSQTAKIISKKLKSTPFKPTESLIKWVEFAAEFDDLTELNLPGEMEMSWFVYYSVDVILFSSIILIIFLWLIFKFANLLFLITNSIFLKVKMSKIEKKKKRN